jgi:hypothetical protein
MPPIISLGRRRRRTARGIQPTHILHDPSSSTPLGFSGGGGGGMGIINDIQNRFSYFSFFFFFPFRRFFLHSFFLLYSLSAFGYYLNIPTSNSIQSFTSANRKTKQKTNESI